MMEAVLSPPAARLRNRQTGTEPLLFHAQGYHAYKPVWPRLRDFVFAQPERHLGSRPRVTLITCNNGHSAMGLFEESAARLGIPVLVAGQEYASWNNAMHKPPAILAALDRVTTPYVLHADSRDVILAGDPEDLVDRLKRDFAAGLVFGACQLSWPNAPELTDYELSLPGATGSEYRHLNGGLWIGQTALAQRFYAAVAATPPHPAAPDSEQGKLRVALRDFNPEVGLDYGLKLFHNLGFLFQDPYDIVTG
jgi:hypothetical protein